MATNVWISCKKAQAAADNVVRGLLNSNWSVSSPGKGDMVHGRYDTCIQIAALEMEGTPKNGALKFVDWIVEMLKRAPVEDFSVIVKTFDGISTSTAWNVGQGTTAVQSSALPKIKKKEEKKPEQKPPEPEEKPEPEEVEAKPKNENVFDEIMNGKQEEEDEEEDVSYLLNREELRVIQRVMNSSVGMSEIFFMDDLKSRKKALKAVNKVLDK